jgi:hypothetical protein
MHLHDDIIHKSAYTKRKESFILQQNVNHRTKYTILTTRKVILDHFPMHRLSQHLSIHSQNEYYT